MARLSVELVVPITAADAADAQRFGPKAANLARLGRAGLPIPDGFCVDAEAYRLQVVAAGLEDQARRVTSPDAREARCAALAMKLGLLDGPIVAHVLDPLLAARGALIAKSAAPIVVRSSALVEDRFGTSFAGQFESYLGLETEDEFVTAVQSCWAALWATRVLRYMATHDANPADTAMAVLIQPLIAARVSGGGLSASADGGIVITATSGLGSALAQGEVVPDRFVLSRNGVLRHTTAGRVAHRVGCAHGAQAATLASTGEPCLTETQAVELGTLLRKAEEVMGMPVEIEWTRDDAGFKLLQVRPLLLEAADECAPTSDAIWLQHPRLNGHPAGVGRGAGRACVVNCECELSRVAPGDVLVTRVAGPSLSQILPRVAGVVAELGGSTSHLASLARERGIPAVLGVLDATQRIPDGVEIAVDGVAGVVRWMPRNL
ncbi:MAG TPA: PEP/pyruvate-binding domain-containing protein [Casimicrobiaceae bacterium]|jgi:pyruvate,water dikinase|nr:PEP/pyruvate-binding domain-containing protein [Casimicrobiaceae bacterium]